MIALGGADMRAGHHGETALLLAPATGPAAMTAGSAPTLPAEE
jgi:hypothetical protein